MEPVCEICGGRRFVKSNGLFMCESCGMRYDLEAMKTLALGDAPEPEPLEKEPAETSSLEEGPSECVSDVAAETPNANEFEEPHERPKATQNPIRVWLSWEGSNPRRVKATIYDPDLTSNYCYAYRSSMPAGEDEYAFCKGFAEQIERDLGRNVRWSMPKDYRPSSKTTQKLNKPNPVGVFVVGALLILFLFAVASRSNRPTANSLRNNSVKATSQTHTDETRATSTKTNHVSTETTDSDVQYQYESSTSSLSEYIYSSEFSNLRATLENACDDLMGLLSSQDTAEVNRRIDALSSALTEFKALTAPDDCAPLRDCYLLASNNTLSGLGCVYQVLTTSGDHTEQVQEATRYFQLAASSITNGTYELERLKKEM